MSPFSADRDDRPSSDPDGALRAAQRRLTELEIEVHRLRAELARLTAAGEERAADALAEQLVATEEDADRERRRLRVVRVDGPEPLRGPKVRREGAEQQQRKAEKVAAVDWKVGAKPTSGGGASRKKKRKRFAPAWRWSFLVHIAALGVAAVVTFASLVDAPPLILSGISSQDVAPREEVDVTEVTLDTVEPTAFEAPIESFTELDTPSDALLDTSLAGGFESSPGLADSLSDLGALAAGASRGDNAGGGDAAGAPSRPRGSSFFGASGTGDRVVFVIDNSGSMVGGRIETVCFALVDSVNRLSPEQSFYVICYSDQAYPMFFPNGVEAPIPATSENKARLAAWVPTIELCTGGQLYDAMTLAASLDPHIVYLLSDGEIRSQRAIDLLTQPNDWKFTLHTLGMTVRQPEHAQLLASFAQAHQGVYRPVGVTPQAVRLAQQRRVKYNRTPGLVWGSNIGKW